MVFGADSAENVRRCEPASLPKRVRSALLDTRVVAITGPRQAGKTTVARSLSEHRAFISRGHAASFDAAATDPVGFLAAYDRQAVTIDEIQRVPKLFMEIKRRVDLSDAPGQYLLTGSADLLTTPQITDSLAGRMQIVQMWPFSLDELAGEPSDFIERAFAPAMVARTDAVSRVDAVDAAVSGGFPKVLRRADPSRRADWFESYVSSMISRDIRDLAGAVDATAISATLRAIAAPMGSTLNIQDISRTLGVPHTTLRRYIALLETAFLVGHDRALVNQLDIENNQGPEGVHHRQRAGGSSGTRHGGVARA